jgi:hypothetical protein
MDTGGYDFEMSTEYAPLIVMMYTYADTQVNQLDICENIYYYSHDLEDILMEKIEECDKVYCDEGIEDELTH